MKKKLFLVAGILFTLSMSFGQTLYFKLKDSEQKAEIVNDRTMFYQSDLSNVLGNYQVKPVLKNPEKFHSIHADRLALTYMVELNHVSDQGRAFLLQNLVNKSAIEYIEIEEEPILVSCPTNDPDDAAWNLGRHEITCVQEAHCITKGDPSIIIAARDNGFIAGHPEHVGQVVYAEPGAYNGACHGTQTSITSAGATDNGFGISSSGYDCSLALYLWGSDFVSDYEDMILRGVRVAHNSYINSCNPIQTHQNIINLVTEQGLIVVGSAGNGNGGANCGGVENNNPTYPSALDNVISVSSVSSSLCCETTYNFWDPAGYDPPLHHTHNSTVDLLAQGYAVVTGNCDGGGQSIAYGTSIAGPHVAGIIGLMLSVNPCLNHDDVLSILQSTGQDVTSICNNSFYYPNGVPPVPCAESAVLAAQSYVGPDLVIATDTDWDQKFVSGNVIIKSGATLTIYGVVSMATNSKIIVEKDADLIIDGGIITSCHKEWKGIVIEGDGASGSQVHAGKVRLQNQAIIENARNAISMNPSHLGWPAVSDHWGGLVQAENSTIRNCHRAMEFMKYGTGFIEDQSYFVNCTFEDIATSAVTIWSNNNVTFKSCTFNRIGERGIYAYDSEVIVNNQCVFTNQHTGVDILTTYPIPFASSIGDHDTPPNDFQCSNYGVFAQAQGNIKPLLVNNNNFLGGLYGVHINGLANYNIFYNDMIGGYAGVEPVSTGDDTHANTVTNNNISSMSYGSHAAFNNGNLEYLDNCFDYNNFSDIYVNNGSIFVEQGNIDLANGNCFTKGGVPEIDNSGNPEIKLWIWENEPTTSCEYPTVIANDPNYNVVVDDFSISKLPDNCGAWFSPGPINVSTFCKGPFKTKAELLAKIAEIEQEISELENDSIITQTYKDYLLKIYKRCLQRLQVSVIIIILEPSPDEPDAISDSSQRIESALSYASSLPLFNQKILAYGLMVNTGQLSRARQYVNGLATENISQSNFIAAQNINLDYLQDVNNYTLSAQNENFLRTVGEGFEPLDGYARSIYEVITGNRIWLDVPDPRSSVRPRSSKPSVEQITFNVYPNPTNGGDISVAIKDAEIESNYTIRLIDIYGRLVYKDTIEGDRANVNTATMPSGTYILSISNEQGKVEYVEKVVVLK